MSSIDLQIKNNNENVKTFDISLNMKGMHPSYMLAFEHILALHCRGQIKGGMLAQQDDFQMTNEPFFELHEKFLKEVQLKVNKTWKKSS